jgi:AcrR family transcriptional regulator
VHRRVARAKAAIEDAFGPVRAQAGYERVAVEDIADRADLARATFYAHYPNKEAVLFAVSNRLVEDLMQRIAYQGRPWNVVRRDALRTAYQHAAEKPDRYLTCMSDARTRQAHLSIVSPLCRAEPPRPAHLPRPAAAHPRPGDGARLRAGIPCENGQE